MSYIDKFIEENKEQFNYYAKSKINKMNIPTELKESILYSLVSNGKKIRPLIFLMMLDYYKIEYKKYYDIALSLELIHVYSLIHDDLPAMDNDNYRWGKLTNHKKFGEDVAILSGDAMQPLAYELIVNNDYVMCSNKLQLVDLLARYSGSEGMVAGQIYDIKESNYKISSDYLKNMHKLKTGRLITLPFLFSAIVSDNLCDLKLLKRFGEELGIAYQIKDDILDYYGEFKKIGKLPSDEKKITYLSFYGIENCQKMLIEHTNEAKRISKKLNNNFLYQLSEILLKRNS